jgi:undecaprenyl-diphosphatase
MSLIHTIIFGIVEGVTEFLPISSTGHLMLTAIILKLNQSDFLKTFEIFIQLGAIMAVVAIYWRKLITNIFLIKKVFIAFLPTAIIGLIFYKIIKIYLMGSNSVVLWALLLGGIFLVLFELFHKNKETSGIEIENISYKQAFIIGLFQSIAMIPGVSRSAATIVGGLALGLKRKTIVEFSFLLAVPTMAAATGLDLIKSANNLNLNDVSLLAVGFAVSFAVAVASIKFLLSFIKNHTFIWFGIYRIVLVFLFWLSL